MAHGVPRATRIVPLLTHHTLAHARPILVDHVVLHSLRRRVNGGPLELVVLPNTDALLPSGVEEHRFALPLVVHPHAFVLTAIRLNEHAIPRPLTGHKGAMEPGTIHKRLFALAVHQTLLPSPGVGGLRRDEGAVPVLLARLPVALVLAPVRVHHHAPPVRHPALPFPVVAVTRVVGEHPMPLEHVVGIFALVAVPVGVRRAARAPALTAPVVPLVLCAHRVCEHPIPLFEMVGVVAHVRVAALCIGVVPVPVHPPTQPLPVVCVPIRELEHGKALQLQTLWDCNHVRWGHGMKVTTVLLGGLQEQVQLGRVFGRVLLGPSRAWLVAGHPLRRLLNLRLERLHPPYQVPLLDRKLPPVALQLLHFIA
mmetsp:Transcript_114136/g.198378  ORF Transcript_114136/g.198378 Transcript_114136/m.198378 type:complete len:367 (+) Transcript_114136:728-1828(+)